MPKTNTMRLPCRLTEEEVRERGERLARELNGKVLLEEKRKEVAAELKRAIDALDAELLDLARAIRDRTEEREVEVETTRDLHRRVLETIRRDTGEVVSARPLGPDELQLNLVPMDRGARDLAADSGRA